MRLPRRELDKIAKAITHPGLGWTAYSIGGKSAGTKTDMAHAVAQVESMVR